MKVVFLLLVITSTFIHKTLGKYYYKDKDGNYDVYYGPNALWGYKEIKPPKSFKVDFDNRGDRPGICQNGNFPCQEPYPFKETYVFECEVDYQCPRYFKCCQQKCFQHKICQPANMEDEEYTEVTELVKTTTPSVPFTTKYFTNFSEMTKPLTSTNLTSVVTTATTKSKTTEFILTTKPTTPVTTKSTVSTETFPTEPKRTTRLIPTTVPVNTSIQRTSSTAKLQTTTAKTTTKVPLDTTTIISTANPLITRTTTAKFISTSGKTTPIVTEKPPDNTKYASISDQTSKSISTSHITSPYTTTKEITKLPISSKLTNASTEATILTTKPHIQTIATTAFKTTTKQPIPVFTETTTHLTAKPTKSIETTGSITPSTSTTVSSSTNILHTTTKKSSTVKQLTTTASTSSKRPKIGTTISHTISDDEDLTFSGDDELITTDITAYQGPTEHIIETTELLSSSTTPSTAKYTLTTTNVPPKSYTVSTPTTITAESKKTTQYNLEGTTVKSTSISSSTPLEGTTRIITSTSDDEDLIFSGDYELVTEDSGTTSSNALSSKLTFSSEIMIVPTLAVKSLEKSTDIIRSTSDDADLIFSGDYELITKDSNTAITTQSSKLISGSASTLAAKSPHSTESTKPTEATKPTVSMSDITTKLNTPKNSNTSTHTEDRIDLTTTSKRSIITDDEDLIFSGDGIEQTVRNSDVTTKLLSENELIAMSTILPTGTSSIQMMTMKSSELEKVAEKQTTSNSLKPIENHKNVDISSSTTTFLSTLVPTTLPNKEKESDSDFKYEQSTQNTHYDIVETSSLHTIKIKPSTGLSEETTEKLSSKSSSLIPTFSDKELGKTTIFTIEDSKKSTTGSITKYTSVLTTNLPKSTATNGKVSSNTLRPNNAENMSFENKILFVNNLLGQLKKMPIEQASSDRYFPAFVDLAGKIPSVLKIDIEDYFNNTDIGSAYENLAFMDMASNQSSSEISKNFDDTNQDTSDSIKDEPEKPYEKDVYFSKSSPDTINPLKEELPDNEIIKEKLKMTNTDGLIIKNTKYICKPPSILKTTEPKEIKKENTQFNITSIDKLAGKAYPSISYKCTLKNGEIQENKTTDISIPEKKRLLMDEVNTPILRII